MGKKTERRQSPRMVMIAKRRLGLTDKKNRVLFEALGRHLECGWDGTKAHGLTLVYRYVAIHKGTPMPVTQRQARAAQFANTRDPRGSVAAAASDAFLETYAWRRLRMEVLVERGARCECCGATPQDGVKMNVDHIKPRRLFPELALEKTNLQVLCGPCNHGKGNWNQTDWRLEPVAAILQLPDQMRPRLVAGTAR